MLCPDKTPKRLLVMVQSLLAGPSAVEGGRWIVLYTEKSLYFVNNKQHSPSDVDKRKSVTSNTIYNTNM